MKRFLIFILFAVLSIGLISCASESNYDSKKAPAANKASESENTQYSPEQTPPGSAENTNAAPADGDKLDDDGKSDADKTGTGGKSDADK